MFFEDLETDRLLLKGISMEDRAFILRQFSDGAVNRYLFDEEPMSDISEAEALIDFYTQPEPRPQHRWILVLKETGEKIGTCGFHRWDRDEGRAEAGYDLGEAYWGRGLMGEAMGAVLAAYVPKMRLTEVDAHIFADNARSVRLAEHLGFRFEGRTLNYAFRGAEYLHRIYALRPGPTA